MKKILIHIQEIQQLRIQRDWQLDIEQGCYKPESKRKPWKQQEKSDLIWNSGGQNRVEWHTQKNGEKIFFNQEIHT